jgi:hypothetical protein
MVSGAMEAIEVYHVEGIQVARDSSSLQVVERRLPGDFVGEFAIDQTLVISSRLAL